MKKTKIENIVIHCSDSDFGTAVMIDQWHRARGWKQIGYMGVILNGYPVKDVYWEPSDGAWEWGRPLNQDNYLEPWEEEAHAFGINQKSVGICLIGKHSFSMRQLMGARQYVRQLCQMWGLPFSSVIGHYEVPNANKSCPNIDMKVFRAFLVDHHLIDDLVSNQTEVKPNG